MVAIIFAIAYIVVNWSFASLESGVTPIVSWMADKARSGASSSCGVNLLASTARSIENEDTDCKTRYLSFYE
jgi:hypothetical protein